MSITVKDCLKLPSLSLGRVIAGHGGLDNIVTNVSVMEFNDTDEEDIVSPNELLISALFCVKGDVDAQCRLIQKARRSGDVGLVLFYSDLILGEISPRFLRVADHLNFPVIMMPADDMGLKYSDVISDVTEAIYMERNAEHYFVSDTMQLLSQSPEQERTPAMVLKLAGSYAKASFFLCDEYENPIASSFWPATNYIDFKKVARIYAEGEQDGIRVMRRCFRDKKDTELVLYAATQNEKLNAGILGEVVEAVQLFSLLWNYNLNPDTPKSLIPAMLRGKPELVRYICGRNHLRGENLTKMLLLEISSSAGFSGGGTFAEGLRELFAESGRQAVFDLFGSYYVIIYQSGASVKDR
ncbi:MAG: PucR family transcriptional regulator ligand-binding domain-containing protein, partial [Emergencia sp.]